MHMLEGALASRSREQGRYIGTYIFSTTDRAITCKLADRCRFVVRMGQEGARGDVRFTVKELHEHTCTPNLEPPGGHLRKRLAFFVSSAPSQASELL